MVTPLSIISDDERMFVEEIEKFAKSQIGPKVLEMDEAEHMDPALIKQLFEMGLMGIEVPEEFGGSGCSFSMAILAIEALGRVDPSVSVLVDVQNTLVNNIFLNWGTDEQKKKYLPQLCGEKVGSYCLTEPNSGSDAFALKARAHDEGDHWRLEGKKIFITNAMEAEIFVVFANINPELGYKGITAFCRRKRYPRFLYRQKRS